MSNASSRLSRLPAAYPGVRGASLRNRWSTSWQRANKLGCPNWRNSCCATGCRINRAWLCRTYALLCALRRAKRLRNDSVTDDSSVTWSPCHPVRASLVTWSSLISRHTCATKYSVIYSMMTFCRVRPVSRFSRRERFCRACSASSKGAVATEWTKLLRSSGTVIGSRSIASQTKISRSSGERRANC